MLCSSCRKPVKPVVALDIDGTLADYHRAFLSFAERWLGTYVHKGRYDGSVSLAAYLGISKETYRSIKLAYRQGGMKRSMPAFDGASDISWALAAAGAEVWVTTTRPYLRLDNIDPDTRAWLDRNQVVYDGLLYDEDKYRVLAENVGKERIVGIIDDQPKEFDRATELGLPIAFVKRHHNSALALHRQPVVVNLTQAQTWLLNRVKEWYARN